jgi:uncharacterized protein (DUF1015 family)
VARIRSLRGFRYTAGGARLASRLAPPYDVISPAERERFAADPHNIVHLELPLDEAGEGSRYEIAARRLRAWIDERVLARDELPRLYAYRQRFTFRDRAYARTGFFGLAELVPTDGSGGVFPHEFTLSGPRQDRLRLLRATGANLSPIFFLYDDPTGHIRERLEHALAHAPLAETKTPWGTGETLGALDGMLAGEIAEAISGSPLVFADGHHRYESALRAHEERCGPGVDGWVLAVFVALQDPGLLVLPTHRIVRAAPAADRWERVIAGVCDRTSLGAFDAGAAVRAEDWLAEQAAAGKTAYVARRAGESELSGLVLREAKRDTLFGAADAPAAPLRRLDVVALHALLEAGLGVTREAITERGALAYSRSADEALLSIDGGARAAFLMNATPIATVVELARQGHRMPQKTTYFEPKLTSGWVLHVFDLHGDSR